MRRHRHTFTLTAPQIERLRVEARRLDIPVSELVRRIVDEWRPKGEVK
jgi:hypothetical protein